MYPQIHFVFVLVLCYSFSVLGACPDITKTGWGGLASTAQTRLAENPPSYVVVHHSETPKCLTTDKCKTRVKNIQYDHMKNRGYSDIGYNFLIGGDGLIYEGRGWGIHGAHSPKFNARSIGVCLIGNFQNEDAPSNQMQALQKLMDCGKDQGKLSSNYKVIGHRQGRSTTCPGDRLFAQIKRFSRWDPNPSY